MEQLLYQLFAWVSKEYGLLGLLQEYRESFMTALAVLGILSCLFGFYLYRGAMSVLMLLCVALAGSLWVRPVAGAQAAVTFSAVLGVSLGFLMFRWYRVGAVALCAAIVGSWMYGLSLHMGFSLAFSAVVVVIGCIAAGIAAFFFPFWSVCGATAIWGAVVFASEGWRLLPVILPAEGSGDAVLMAIFLSVAGAVCQLVLFRHQKLFPRIMPQRMEYALQKKKEKRRAEI